MWLVYWEMMDGCKILHGRNGHEYRMPELPHLNVDGFLPGTKMVYEFCFCYYHGHACLYFRDVSTMAGAPLAEMYEHTMARL